MDIPETLMRAMERAHLETFIAQLKRTRRRQVEFSLNMRSVVISRADALALAKKVHADGQH